MTWLLVVCRYLEMLLEYLQDYTDRVKPLLDQNDLYGRVLTDFEKKWDTGTFPGWPVGSPATVAASAPEEAPLTFWSFPCRERRAAL